MRALVLAAMLCAGCFTPRAYMPVTGGGPFLNVGLNDQALTNASAHIGWSLAIGLGGWALGGRQGLRAACGVWSGASLIGEAFFHAPAPSPMDGQPGDLYPSEVRTDLITKIVPCSLLVLVEALHDPAR